MIAFLNDDWFWFACGIIRVTGTHIFKHMMKFLESQNGLLAHEIYFELQFTQNLIVDLKENIDTEFADILQFHTEVRKSIILAHLDAVAEQLQLRFGDWEKMPFIWAALASTKVNDAKILASQLLYKLKVHKDQLSTFINWRPLENLVQFSCVIQELEKFAKEQQIKFEDLPRLVHFHRQHFIFVVHNVECERAIGKIYAYKQEATAAEVTRVSAVVRTRFNQTNIPTNELEKYWNNPIIFKPTLKSSSILEFNIEPSDSFLQTGKIKL